MAKADGGLGDAIMEIAENLEGDYRDILDQRAANRRTLRDLATQNLLSDAQVKRVDEIYPPRERKAADEAVAA